MLAAIVLETWFYDASERLRATADRYFAEHGVEAASVVEAIERGWIVNLPRLRDMLCARLRHLEGNVRQG